MEKCHNIYVNYVPSDKIERQGKRKDIQSYLNGEYHIQEEKNGYWVLVKYAQVSVTVSTSLYTKSFNMKEDILNYYSQQKLSRNLVDRFEREIKSGEICIYLDESGYCKIK